MTMNAKQTTEMNFETLQTAVNDKNNDAIINELKNLLTEAKETRGISNTSIFHTIYDQFPNDVIIYATNLIADLIKYNSDTRKLFTDEELIKKIFNGLTADICLQIQTCRALANISYENEQVKVHLEHLNVYQTTIELLKANLDHTETFLSDSGNIKDPDLQNYNLLRICLLGLLTNYLHDNSKEQETALESGILPVIERVLVLDALAYDICDYSANTLSLMVILFDCGCEQWLSADTCRIIVGLMNVSDDPRILNLCVEVLHSQAENDDIKLILAENNLCELMFTLLEKYKNEMSDDEEEQEAIQTACNLIVLILTGDKSMNLLYKNGNGKTFTNMIKWLESDNMILKITGVLAMGNFARTEEHCLYLSESGTAKKLLDMLRENSNANGDYKLQHALLGALKNLAIPTSNKNHLIENGLIDIIETMLAIDEAFVTFKLLGTLRIVIDGQKDAACKIGSNLAIVTKIIYWCYNTDHVGIKGESSRLLAWILKNSRGDQKVNANVLQVDDSIRCLVDMVPAKHFLMQNEAILGLNYLLLHNFNCNQVEDIQKFADSLGDLRMPTTPTSLKSSDHLNVFDDLYDSKAISERASPISLGSADETSTKSPPKSPIAIRIEHDDTAQISDDIVAQRLIVAELGQNIALLLENYASTLHFEVVDNLISLITLVSGNLTVKQHLIDMNVHGQLAKLLTNQNCRGLTDKINGLIGRFSL